MTDDCAIMIRTYHRDVDWLKYALASIGLWCVGFREVFVVTPRFSATRVGRVLPAGVRLVVCPDYRDDYLGQQVSKVYADRLTPAAMICHLDADMVFTRLTTPADLCVDGRPRVARRPVAQLGRHRPWVGPTETFLGRPVAFDFMQQPPFVYPRWLYGAVRAHCEQNHGVPLDEYVLSRPPRGFSEFNALGAYAHEHHPAAFAWCEPDEHASCRWYWSRAGLDARTRADLRQILGQ